MSSLLASAFDQTPPTRVAYVSRSLDHALLRVQPVARSGTMPPALPIPSTHDCCRLKWVSDSLILVMFSNKGEVWVVDSNLGQVVQTIQLQFSGSSVDSTWKSANGIVNVWIVDSNNRVYHYVVEGDQLQEVSDWKIDEITEPVSQIEALNDSFVLVSNAIYSYNVEEKKVTKSLNLFVGSCERLQLIDNNKYCVASAKNDRFVNLVDLEQFKVVSIFSLNDPCVNFQFQKVDETKNILATLDERGYLEIFNDPLNLAPKLSSNNSNSKRRRTAVRTVQPQYSLKLSEGRFDQLAFNNNELVLAYYQNESFFVFDNYNWSQNLNQEGEIEILRIKQLNNNFQINNEDKSSFSTYKENNAVVGTSLNLLDLEEPRPEDEDDEDEEEEDEDFGSLTSKLLKSQLNVSKGGKVHFAVGTLSMNLVQALKTNDNQAFNTLLDRAHDEQVIRSTVSKLDIHYVMKLLDKLGELNFKNKFQALDLNVWIKYLLIFHGNYIIGVPHLKSKLTLLTISLKNRSVNMKRLLELKSKLNLVTQRVEIVKEIEAFEANLGNEQEEEEEADVEYYEELEDAENDEMDIDEENDDLEDDLSDDLKDDLDEEL